MSAKVLKMWTKYVLRIMLIKQSYRIEKSDISLVVISQVVQKQTLGEVGNWMVIWWQDVSWIFLPKIIKIW